LKLTKIVSNVSCSFSAHSAELHDDLANEVKASSGGV